MTEQEKVKLNLSPARWIWATGERTLPNTFVCFRRTFTVREGLISAKGFVLASSRYVLSANGNRVQFGPAPADPRFEEADPVDLTPFLRPGKNALGFRVVYFGHGDGTWVMGRPGLIYKIQLEFQDGREETLVSDEATLFAYDESHPAGQYKRWYLRALQEEYDARKDCIGFDRPDFAGEALFEPVRALPGPADKPSAMNGAKDYLYGSYAVSPEKNAIFARTIPLPKETFIPAEKLMHAETVIWKRDPDNWFRFRQPGSFEIGEALPVEKENGAYRFILPPSGAAAITLKLPEEACGFIDFTIDAPEGTIVEAMVQEGHDPRNTRWLDTQFYAWTRFICRAGRNHFVSFDYECFAFLQLHVRNASGFITISRAGVLRREYPVPEARIRAGDPEIQTVLDAAVNTLRNSAIETFCDGMARERQQYSGDGNHQVTAFSHLYGAGQPLVFRFYDTFGQGFAPEGYYMDCWPAYDRVNRVAQRQIAMAGWGPILDHGIQYVLSTVEYTLHTGNESILKRNWPDFVRQAEALLNLRDEKGLVQAEAERVSCIWMDHEAFSPKIPGETVSVQRNKTCAFNLYLAGMLRFAMAPAARRLGLEEEAARYEKTAEQVYQAVKRVYYDPERELYFDNLPFSGRETPVVSDRTLAMALLYGFVSDGPEEMVRALAETPPWVGLSYPANAVWRWHALANYGRCDVITAELKGKWRQMLSVDQNNTLQEWYEVQNDTDRELSHCPMAPVLAMYEDYAGLRCLKDGFREFSLNPCMGGLPSLAFTLRTVSGDMTFDYREGRLTVCFPPAMRGSITLGQTVCPLISGETVTVPMKQR